MKRALLVLYLSLIVGAAASQEQAHTVYLPIVAVPSIGGNPPPRDVRYTDGVLTYVQQSAADESCVTYYQPDWFGDLVDLGCRPSAPGANSVEAVLPSGVHVFLEFYRARGTRHADWLGHFGPFDIP